MKYFKLRISQKLAERPQDSPYNIWEKETSSHSTIKQVLERLEEIYRYENGYQFIKGNEVYRDTEDGPEHIGYHYSYWTEVGNRSSGPKKSWATDWIRILKVENQPATQLLSSTSKAS